MIAQTNEQGSRAEPADSNFASTPKSSMQKDAEVRVASNQNDRPAMQLLLVCETDAVRVYELTVVALPRGPVLVWSVQMMRVTVAAPVWKEMRLPAAKKI